MYVNLAHFDKGINKSSFNKDYFWNPNVSAYIYWSENKDLPDTEEIKEMMIFKNIKETEILL